MGGLVHCFVKNENMAWTKSQSQGVKADGQDGIIRSVRRQVDLYLNPATQTLSVIWYKLISLSLNFLICKRAIMIPTSKKGHKD